MLIISLVVSALLLLIANLAVRYDRKGTGPIVATCAFFLIAPFFAFCILPALALQSLLLCGLAIEWRRSGRGSHSFLKWSLAVSAVAYGVAGGIAWNDLREYARLRAMYPYESLDARLPAMPVRPELGQVPPATAERLNRLEDSISDQLRWKWHRNYQLKALHEHAVATFINSPGFGVARIIRPTEDGLVADRRRPPVPAQPGVRTDLDWSPGEPRRLPPDDEAPLGEILDASVLDFVFAGGFGYVKDRQHVAGFEPHRFSQVPEPAESWEVQTVELVSLLLHDEPEVYVSADLPAMDRLHGTPTRPLNRFESYALDELRRGEDMVTTADGDGSLRMVGAIRTINSCTNCHGGNRGDLLGAFSYTLRSDLP